MFDDIIECNECGGPLGPPPKFMVPPPPRPPSMAAYEAATNCNEEEMALKAQLSWDNDMCEAIPVSLNNYCFARKNKNYYLYKQFISNKRP